MEVDTIEDVEEVEVVHHCDQTPGMQPSHGAHDECCSMSSVVSGEADVEMQMAETAEAETAETEATIDPDQDSVCVTVETPHQKPLLNPFRVMMTGSKKKACDPDSSGSSAKRQRQEEIPKPVVPAVMKPAPKPREVAKRDEDGNFIMDPERPWHPEWETHDDFRDWIEVDYENGMVRCRYCHKTNQINVFTHGRPITSRWKRNQLTQHATRLTQCEKHKTAKEIFDKNSLLAASMKRSRRAKMDSIRGALQVVVRGVYWLCLESIAMMKIASLYKLVRSLPGMPQLESVEDMSYVNSARCREFVMSLSSVLKGRLWADILASPFVSVLIDESTDVSTSENMIIYMIYLHEGLAVVSYAGLVHVPDIDAESITNTLLGFFEQNGLELAKIIGFCSDGASVMTGWKNGVAARLKRLNPFIQSVHCIAHRLALCSADAAQDLDYQSGAEVTINEISSYFNRSGKRTVSLKALTAELDISRSKIVKSGKTRWLSRGMAINAICTLFAALVHLFAADGEAVAQTIHSMIVEYSFASTLCGMKDTLGVMNKLSAAFQADLVDYSTIVARLSQTRNLLVSWFLRPQEGADPVDPNCDKEAWDKVWNDVLDDGCSTHFQPPTAPHTKEFLAETAGTHPTFKGVQLSKSASDETTFLTWICKFAIALMSRLAERFPHDDMKIMQAMEIFNPAHCPRPCAPELDGYGDVDLEVILKHYGTAKVVDGTKFPPMVDADAARLEWAMLKFTISECRESKQKFTEFWRDQLNSGALNTLPEMRTLVTMRLIYPSNTACCERGFSRMKLVKSSLRNRLYIETLDALMAIGLLGDRYVKGWSDHTFFEDVMVDWENQCMRAPHQARFGNTNAKKKVAEVRTELPPTETDCHVNDSDLIEGLDSSADADEMVELPPPVDCGAEQPDVYADLPNFVAPKDHLIITEVPTMTPAALKKAGKFAYKFPEGWELGTFSKFYKGKDPKYRGHVSLYFRAFKRHIYVELLPHEYGYDQMWVNCIKKSKK